jgi:hypothetical protein
VLRFALNALSLAIARDFRGRLFSATLSIFENGLHFLKIGLNGEPISMASGQVTD